MVLVDQRLADAALEAVELRLDDAEANLSEALRCGDPRRRDSVSMFMLRNVQRAAMRGYAVAASAARSVRGRMPRTGSRPVQTYVFSWWQAGRRRGQAGPRALILANIGVDGRIFQTPR